ncbi:MAG: HlyC/CorC family transporter [Verrucomicrobia bacterium]|nr:HlyC/CorC family transporter [Verrucomicrobiota bacterium]
MWLSTLIFLLILLVGLSGFFSASETALFSLSPMKVSLFAKEKSYRKRLVARLLEKPKELLVTLLMLNMAINIAIQNIASEVFGDSSSGFLTVGIPLLMTLLFGETVPKSLAISHNASFSTKISPILYGLQFLIGPFRVLMTAIATFFSRIFFFFLKKEKEITQEELKHALKASKDRGVITQDEAKLISGSLNLEEMMAKEFMSPRQEILFYDIKEPLDRLVRIFIDEECTQVPVIDGEIDHLIGIMTSSLYFLHRSELKEAEDLKRYVKEPLFFPETVTARNLLAHFQFKGETIALLVDEYGVISGLVTKEDIVEIVIGQIEDKRDEKALFTRQGEDVIITSGKLEVAELEELFDIQLDPEISAVTIGGWLTEKMGDIPKSGIKFLTEDFLFHVLSSTPTRVSRLYIRRLNSKKPVKKRP